MKTIGLLGGMSWESTLTYYRLINEGVKTRLGGLHSAEIVLYSVDFDPIEKRQHRGDWGGAGKMLAGAARRVEAAGADFLLICTNTMHKVAAQIQAAIDIPLLHIADATGKALRQAGLTRVGLLGTAFTMEHDFYKGRLTDTYGLEVLVPQAADRQQIHAVIFNELCLGICNSDSQRRFVGIVERLARQGAQGVILGCTEIGLLIDQTNTVVPLFDTTMIHAEAAVNLALESGRRSSLV